MKKLNIVKKILSFVTCSVLSVTLIAVSPSLSDSKTPEISAMTLAEIQEERQANQDKIKELEQKISSLEGNIDNEKEVQEYLSDQIELIQQNISFINAELDNINKDISNTQNNIDELDRSIIEQQAQIDESIEIFKSRLSEMYITGNENLASIILGSSSFYDVMSRVEMANRMAAYDEELINGLLSDIDNLEQSKKGLETEKLTLEMKLDEQERKKEERAADLAVLGEKMQKTQEEIDRIERERQLFEEDLDALKSRDESLKAEEDNIIETIRREEEKRKQEEALKLQQQQQQQQQQNPGSTPPSYPAAPSGGGFMWPCPGFYYISSYYGYRWGRNHNGIDVGDAGIHGGAAVASKSGTVIYVANSCTHDYPKSTVGCGCGGNYGNYVLIQHDSTYTTIYAHLASVAVSVGDTVQQGQVIGYIGSTGWSTGDHLHFEIRAHGYAQDPMAYL